MVSLPVCKSLESLHSLLLSRTRCWASAFLLLKLLRRDVGARLVDIRVVNVELVLHGRQLNTKVVLLIGWDRCKGLPLRLSYSSGKFILLTLLSVLTDNVLQNRWVSRLLSLVLNYRLTSWDSVDKFG